MGEKRIEKLKISPVKGRPMLHWVGKTAPSVGRYYPPQLRERVGAGKAAKKPTYDAFMDDKNGHNFLFHGDNKEVLTALLVGGFRGKVDLIYIDPPFDSGADYVRKVELRGRKEELKGAGRTTIEKAQYEDIWANDNYLQFMYERLILLRELMSERGSIYLHCDWRKSHHLRFLLDEIFGADSFKNEISWRRQIPRGRKVDARFMPYSADYILLYSKGEDAIWNAIQKVNYISIEDAEEKYKKDEGGFFSHSHPGSYTNESLMRLHEDGRIYVTCGGKAVVKNGILIATKGTIRVKYYRKQVGNKIKEVIVVDNIWDDIHGMGTVSSQHLGYPTQKPEALLKRIITASSEPDSIVLDCFGGSGTLAAVAEELGLRWIVSDLNKGAIQTTMKRLGKILSDGNGGNGYKHLDKRRGFAHYRVNNYDFAEESVLRELAIEKYNIEKLNGRDLFFNGVLAGELVRIAELNRPLNENDVELVRKELAARRDETRNIVILGNGCEVGLEEKIAKGDKRRAINKIRIIDLQQDGMFTYKAAEADVKIRKSGKTATVKIADYSSPMILAKLKMSEGVFGKKIVDFRAMIDRVLFDCDYDGKCFNITCDDSPEKKTDLIRGDYKIALPRPGATLAVKIVDMLGEETLITK